MSKKSKIMIEEHTRERMIEMQNEMRKQINTLNNITNVRYVAGADLTCEDDLMIGCFVVCDIQDLTNPIYSKCTSFHVDVPYQPGLLCFREGPVVLQMLKEFEDSVTGVNIDLILTDGCGVWHPRSFGLACYVGVKCNIPTAGVSKTYLYVGNNLHSKEVQKEAQEKCPNRGDYFVLEHILEDGIKIQCAVMRTTDSKPFNPIYISCGNMCSLESVVDVVRKLCVYREPEPLRLADRISRHYVAELKKNKETTN